jgi:hypothetical protein
MFENIIRLHPVKGCAVYVADSCVSEIFRFFSENAAGQKTLHMPVARASLLKENYQQQSTHTRH